MSSEDYATNAGSVATVIGESTIQVCASTISIIIAGTLAAIGIYGGIYYHDNDCDRDLALWLLVTGMTHCIIMALSSINIIRAVICTAVDAPVRMVLGAEKSPFSILSSLIKIITSIPGCLIAIFMFVWLILGTIWLSEVDSDDSGCPDTLYRWTLGYIITIWIIYTAQCLCVIVLVFVSIILILLGCAMGVAIGVATA